MKKASRSKQPTTKPLGPSHVPESAPAPLAALTPEDTGTLLHALQVHQVELEMQNEELRRAGVELDESRALYSDLYDLAPVGYVTLSETGLVLQSNLTLSELLGVARGELATPPFSRFIFKADQDTFHVLLRQLLASRATPMPGSAQVNITQHCELRMVGGDGLFFWAHLSCTAATAASGNVTVRVMVLDITERKQAEGKLAARERHLRAIFETEPECVKVLAADGSLLEMNPAGLRMLQADSFEQVENYCVYPLVVEEHRAAFRELVATVFRGNSGRLEFQITGLKGARAWLETHASPLRDATGAITALLGVTRDITEHKHSEAILAGETRALEMIARGVPATETFNFLMQHIEKLDPGMRCSLLLLDPDGLHLRHFAAPSLPEVYTRAIDGLAIGPNVGSCGTAAYRGETVIVTDIASDPLWADFRALALPHGLRACWSTPIRDEGGRVMGTFAIYHGQPGLPTAEQLQCIGMATHLAAIALQNQRKDEALRVSNLAFQAVSQGVLISGPDHVIVSANDAFVAITGYALNDILGRNCRFLQGPGTDPKTAQAIREALSHGNEFTGEILNYRKDGESFWNDLTISPVRDQAGHLTHFIGVTRDVTLRKRKEAELALQSAALNAAANSIVITDSNAAIMWVNPAFTELTGYRAEEAIGKKPQDLVNSGQQDQAFYKQLWDTILAGNVWQGTLTNRRKDGSLYPERQTITPVKNDRGEITHFIGIKRDLTQEKQLQAQFLQAQKMEVVGQLAAGVAHDFNNLLTVVNGTAELAMMSLGEADLQHTSFLRIHQAGKRAATLTRQLMAFSRQQVLAPVRTDLSALVADLKDMLTHVIGEDINLVVVPATEPGTVSADPGQIEQVVMNLVVNARDAMPGGGTLTIETRVVTLDQSFATAHPPLAPGPHVLLRVSDTGTGMDSATCARIFEPFFTTKEIGRGSGLGLSTVFGIVGQSGGAIWVESTPGKGTTFWIGLPRIEAVAQQSEPDRSATLAHGTGTILIVEDEATLRAFASSVLKLAGYAVLTAADGEEALRLMESHDGPVNLIFTDMVMPGMRGTEVAARVADIHPEIKVLYASGYTDDQVLRDGLLNETSHFIGKPYSVIQLASKVREVLES